MRIKFLPYSTILLFVSAQFGFRAMTWYPDKRIGYLLSNASPSFSPFSFTFATFEQKLISIHKMIAYVRDGGDMGTREEKNE